ncbi:putative bifunctional diguanylate cyclase/phosphodiesterase [Deinococcus cellulosilyticus]|uniref:Diguanylate cyclase/phosphodiesterase with PAS/PAC sensor(S) n=1 Tax=Deinococcus cellulosilyticus (strain DSM 18568 / NBRC 106333 / KACC 11606 / 5516J-15) TaxID=1223518 RepID=A0A511N721_DEIC1|nr:EAL domain-containing protein [Deinococcus cellulosilyticus]GEM48256.1 hypothetical protein DC3_38910 [Deinococcus cellulosilyticus NBRC 106333 = KACC 11606]
MNIDPAQPMFRKDSQTRQKENSRLKLKFRPPRVAALLGLLFAFLVPLAVMLFFFLSEINDRIAFSKKELRGLEYTQGAARVLEILSRQRLLTSYNLAEGTALVDPELDRELEQAVSTLEALTRQYGKSLDLLQDWESWLNGWRNVHQQTSDSQLLNAASQAFLIQEVQHLMAKAGDTSNLILDPELDTYYLMNGLINILPQLASQRGDILHSAMQIAASQRTLMTEGNHLSVKLGLLAETQDRLWHSLEHAMTDSPDLSGTLKPVMQQNLNFQHLFEDTVQSKLLDTSDISVSSRLFFELGDQALSLQSQLDRQMAHELAGLLNIRIGTLETRRNVVLLLALIMVGVSFVVVQGFLRTMRRQQGLEANAQLISTVFSTSGEAFFIADLKQRITGINPAFEQITGYGLEDVLHHPALMLAERAYDNEVYRGLLEELTTSGQYKGEVFFRRRNNQVYPVQLSITVLKDARGVLSGYVGSFADISEKKEFEHSLLHLVHHDVLTGLPNRALFEDRVQHALVQQSHGNGLVAVLFLNLDHFKQINEGFGHATGDLILCEVASRLKQAVCEHATVARQGGDEFMVLLPDAASWEAVADVAQLLLDALSVPFRVENDEFALLGSIGITMAPRDGQDVGTLLKNADTAVSRAKRQGRNTFQFYTAEMNAVTLEKLRLENELRHALSRKELVLHYQPQVNLQTGQVIGVEALIRWKHPTMGMVSPAKFIPLAEESGLIVPIGEWVLREACQQSIRWQEMGLPALKMSVNLSALQFKKQDVAELVRLVLEETGLAPHLLDLEFTESLVMEDTEHILAVLASLKQIGVRLSVDDFGTGYSSLSYLKRFPVDTIKIDRAFVQSVHHTQEDAMLTRAIIALAHSMNLKTVAEGVETEAQLDFLMEHQCNEVQGFYFSRPLVVQDLEQLLLQRAHFEIKTSAIKTSEIRDWA